MSGLNLGLACPLIGIIMGSQSDYETLSAAEDVLLKAQVPYEISVVSAHRTPEHMYEYATSARARGLKILIAGAGGAAHLPGMVAALSTLPVLGVPVQSKALNGLDSLLSIVQMPAGIPTATFAIGKAGATNAALFAIQILGLESPGYAEFIEKYREDKRMEVEQAQHIVQKRTPQSALVQMDKSRSMT